MFFSKTEIKTTPELPEPPKPSLDELRDKASIYISFKQLASRGYTTFSVERKCVNQGKGEHTIVSCIDTKGEPYDFEYECSLMQHNAVVMDFIKFCNETKTN